jgi:hypothetical protein
MPASRIAVAALVVVAGLLAWPKTDEDRVRAVVEGAVADFAAGSFRPCIEALDADFLDTSGDRRIDRQTLLIALRALRSSEGAQRRGIYVRFTEGRTVDIELSRREEPDLATAQFSVEFLELHPKAAYVDPDAPVLWAIDVDAVLRRGEDGSWRFWRSDHQTSAGTPLYR